VVDLRIKDCFAGHVFLSQQTVKIMNAQHDQRFNTSLD